MAENTETVEATETPAKKPAKQPQDRKTKADKPKSEKVDVTIGEGDEKRTVTGYRVTIRSFTVTVLEEVFLDYELMELMAEIQTEGENPIQTARMLKLVLQPADHARMKDALRGPNGRVSIDVAAQYCLDLLEAVRPSS